MQDPERDEPESLADSEDDLDLEPDEMDEVKGGGGGMRVGPSDPGG
jgi:hypothetical protein